MKNKTKIQKFRYRQYAKACGLKAKPFDYYALDIWYGKKPNRNYRLIVGRCDLYGRCFTKEERINEFIATCEVAKNYKAEGIVLSNRFY